VRYLNDTVVVFQDSNLVPDLPVRGQLERRIALHRGLATRDVRSDVDRWCVEMELESAVDRIPEKLNRAELQLLSLAPLALAEPAVVLLDEPLMNLSPIGVGHALEMILALLEKAAVLAVCQSRSSLTGKADRVVNLR
jgi:energy-coupling factor transport system ATP-binding protein